MIFDAVVVAVALSGAVGYLVWRLLPGRRTGSPCAACPRAGSVAPVARRLR